MSVIASCTKKCEKCNRLYYTAMSGDGKPYECQSPQCKMCGEKLPCDSKEESEVHWCYIQPLPVETEHTEKTYREAVSW